MHQNEMRRRADRNAAIWFIILAGSGVAFLMFVIDASMRS